MEPRYGLGERGCAGGAAGAACGGRGRDGLGGAHTGTRHCAACHSRWHRSLSSMAVPWLGAGGSLAQAGAARVVF